MKNLIEYIAQYDPNYPATVRGATKEEIDAFEQRVGSPLPPSYRAFLRAMGHDMGSLVLFDGEIDFRMDAVAALYEDPDWAPPDRYLCIGVDVTASHYFIEHETRWEPPVVTLDDAPVAYMIYESLPRMLFGLSFLLKRMPLFQFHARLTSSTVDAWDGKAKGERMAILANIAEAMQFTPVPHTGGWFSCYEHEDAAILGFRSMASIGDFQVAASSELELKRLVEILSTYLKVWRIS